MTTKDEIPFLEDLRTELSRAAEHGDLAHKRRPVVVRTLRVTLLVVVVAGAFLIGESRRGTQARAADDPAIRQIADYYAAETGEQNPSAGAYVQTTLQDASAVTGDGAAREPDQAVYLVVMHGTFTAANGSIPGYVTKVPTGTVLTLTVAADSYQLLDLGVSSVAPDLAALGVVHQLP